MRIPPGGAIWNTEWGPVVVYDIGGLTVVFDDDGMDLTGVPVWGPPVSLHDIKAGIDAGTIVNGGPLSTITGIPDDKTWGQWIEDKLLVLSGGNKDLVGDPEVRALLVKRALDIIDDTELQVRLQQTRYYQGRTDAQRDWTGLSEAEKLQRVLAIKSQLADLYFQNVGVDVDLNDETSVTEDLIHWYATEIASGQKTVQQIIEQWIKPEARKNPESPWSRTVRNEEENKRQRGVDIENTTGRVRELAHRWGITMTDETLREWGQKLVENQDSEADFLEQLKSMAQVLYPGKDRELETSMWAEPYMATFSRVFEVAKPDIFNPRIQQAMTAGQSSYDFEKGLKLDPKWLETQNAKETLTQVASRAGSIMGFV